MKNCFPVNHASFFWWSFVGPKMLTVLHFSLFWTMSETNYKSGNFQRDNTSVERIGHFQSWSDRKKLTSVKWRKVFWKIFQKWTWMVPNILEWHFWKRKWKSDGWLKDCGGKKTQWSCSCHWSVSFPQHFSFAFQSLPPSIFSFFRSFWKIV